LKLKWLTFLIFAASVRLFAQGLQDWQTITYMNDVTDMASANEECWVSTTGGVYNLNISDNTIETFTNIDGLGSLDLTSVDTDNYGTVIAGSRDGLINRLNRITGLWTVYNDLIGEEIVDLHVHYDTLWVATNTGIGVFLVEENNLDFRDYYTNLPLTIENATRTAVFNGRVFYATNQGLLHAPSNFIKNNLKVSEAWKTLTVNNGLPSNAILDIVPTEDSLLVGTTEGFASVNKNNVVSEIRSWDRGRVDLIRVSETTIYLVNNREFFMEFEDSWVSKGSAHARITSAIIDNLNELWIGIEDGGIKHSQSEKYLLIDGPASNYMGPLVKDRDGILWISSGKFKVPRRKGFYRYDLNTWTNYTFLDNNWVRKSAMVTVFEDLTGKIWFGTWGGGIAVIDDNNDSMEFYHGWAEEGRLKISSITSEYDTIIASIDEEKRNCFTAVDVSIDEYLVIPSFLEDDAGNLWVTNHGADDGDYVTVIPRNENGALEGDCSNWVNFGRNIGIMNNEGQVSALEFDDFNRAWIGTFTTGIIVFNYNGTVSNRSDDQPIIRVNTSSYPSLFSNIILSIKKDLDGIIWIGTAGGLNSFDGQNFFRHVGEIGPIENKINAIFVDDFNNKWFATDGGLSILKADESPWEPSAWVHYTPENSGLPNKIVNSIFVDQKVGEAYLGTESGLSIFTGSFAELKEEMTSVVSGPSPYVLDGQKDFIIKNLVFGATVKILNVNGKLVRILTQDEGNIEGGRASWDGRDQNGSKVSSGIYIFLVYNDEGVTANGKIAVIKP
jgi:ligand-binding sensor domain-containing protein